MACLLLAYHSVCLGDGFSAPSLVSCLFASQTAAEAEVGREIGANMYTLPQTCTLSRKHVHSPTLPHYTSWNYRERQWVRLQGVGSVGCGA